MIKSKKKEVSKEVKKLVEVLEFFSQIKKPLYKPEECPFELIEEHYLLSEATGGLGCWKWNCPLCGEEHQE